MIHSGTLLQSNITILLLIIEELDQSQKVLNNFTPFNDMFNFGAGLVPLFAGKF